MQRVCVLHESMYSQNGAAFLFPLRYHARALRERGVMLCFTTDPEVAASAWDVLCVSSRTFMSWWRTRGPSSVTSYLERARIQTPRIIWFDITDSTGTTQFDVLPYVDRYCKNQVLRDRTRYRRHVIGARVFTDYYAREFGISESISDEAHLNVVPADVDLHKIGVGWNSGLAHYGVFGPKLQRMWHWTRRVVPRWYPQQWTSPRAPRSILVSCRIGTSHHRQTVARPRQELARRLQAYLRTEKLSRRAYFEEMRRSRAIISPFGLGEITLRDFEAITCGALVLKQDMSHVETWPDLWVSDETYLPFAWDFSDLDARLQEVECRPERMAAIATEAQRRYARVLSSREGTEEFCNRFLGCIVPATDASHRPLAVDRAITV